MKIEKAEELPKESESRAKAAEFEQNILEFQASKHYDFVISIIEKARDKSTVVELLNKSKETPSESEIGRLTMVDWLKRKEIQTEILDKLTKEI